MMSDNALAKFSIFPKMLDGGDTGKRGVEHRNVFQLWFTHLNVSHRSCNKPPTFPACCFLRRLPSR